MKFQGKQSVRYIKKYDLQYIKKADLTRSSSPNIPEYTQQVTIPMCLHKVHWIMYEHDADINDPSCPHCHAKERNWKLDIYTGEIYDYSQGKRYIGPGEKVHWTPFRSRNEDAMGKQGILRFGLA